MKMTRVWAMPHPSTFTIPPIRTLVRAYLQGCAVVVDPFARNSRMGTHRNDWDPSTAAESHLPAVAFCEQLLQQGVRAEAVLFDPPYSPRQIAEVYKGMGLTATEQDTQNAALYREVRDGLDRLLVPGGLAISCGWNTTGFGTARYTPVELLVVAHGGAHNDTLVLVERKDVAAPRLFGEVA
jgi:hypothetical protein